MAFTDFMLMDEDEREKERERERENERERERMRETRFCEKKRDEEIRTLGR